MVRLVLLSGLLGCGGWLQVETTAAVGARGRVALDHDVTVTHGGAHAGGRAVAGAVGAAAAWVGAAAELNATAERQAATNAQIDVESNRTSRARAGSSVSAVAHADLPEHAGARRAGQQNEPAAAPVGSQTAAGANTHFQVAVTASGPTDTAAGEFATAATGSAVRREHTDDWLALTGMLASVDAATAASWFLLPDHGLEVQGHASLGARAGGSFENGISAASTNDSAAIEGDADGESAASAGAYGTANGAIEIGAVTFGSADEWTDEGEVRRDGSQSRESSTEPSESPRQRGQLGVSISAELAAANATLVDPALRGDPGQAPERVGDSRGGSRNGQFSGRQQRGVRAIGRGEAHLGGLLNAGLNVNGHRLRLGDLGPIADLYSDEGWIEVKRDANVVVRAQLEHESIATNGGETHVAVQVEGLAPATETGASSSPPGLRVHVVIDRSSSMQSTWHEAIAAAKTLIDALDSEDEIQIVAYGSDANVIFPPTAVGDGAAAKAAMGTIGVGGGTNIEAGLELAYREARRGSMVILISDGVPNAGAIGADELAPLAAAARRRVGCTTTVLGLGSQFDADVLRQIAAEGRGGYHVARSSRELGEVLRAEIMVQKNIAAAGVKIAIEAASGVELLGSTRNNGCEIDLPVVRAGETLHLSFPVRIGASARQRQQPIVAVRLGSARATLNAARGQTRRTATPSIKATFADQALGRAMHASAQHVLNGRAEAAAATLRAHVSAHVSASGAGAATGALGFRTDAVGRFADAIEALVPSSSHTARREMSLAMGSLAVRLTR